MHLPQFTHLRHSLLEAAMTSFSQQSLYCPGQTEPSSYINVPVFPFIPSTYSTDLHWSQLCARRLKTPTTGTSQTVVKRDQETSSGNCADGRQAKRIMGTQRQAQVLLSMKVYHIELWLFTYYFANLLYSPIISWRLQTWYSFKPFYISTHAHNNSRN